MPKTILFYRDFRQLTGGHLKVFHYFEHFRSFPEFRPFIYFSPKTRWDRGNPWSAGGLEPVPDWKPEDFDALFLAGMDWTMLSREAASKPIRPVINLIQGLRHSDIDSRLRSFLPFPAVRICVSQQVADAITATGEVNGPVHVIPNAIEDMEIKSEGTGRDPLDLLIIGNKNPYLANSLYANLKQLYSCRNLPSFVPRSELLNLMRCSRVTLCLPMPREGFYLPALEAMGAGSLVVCPDCVGNRDFCLDGWNMLKPDFNESSIEQTLHEALRMRNHDRAMLLKNAQRTAARHRLGAERIRLRNILGQYAAFSGRNDADEPRARKC